MEMESMEQICERQPTPGKSKLALDSMKRDGERSGLVWPKI